MHAMNLVQTGPIAEKVTTVKPLYVEHARAEKNLFNLRGVQLME